MAILVAPMMILSNKIEFENFYSAEINGQIF
jgi:hypothetical protein